MGSYAKLEFSAVLTFRFTWNREEVTPDFALEKFQGLQSGDVYELNRITTDYWQRLKMAAQSESIKAIHTSEFFLTSWFDDKILLSYLSAGVVR